MSASFIKTPVQSRTARVYRGAVIAVVSTFIAALSHVLAGGNIPTFIAMVATTLIALPLVVLLTSKRFKLFGSFAAVGFTQALFHTIFVYAGTGIRPGSAEALPLHAAHMGMMEQFVPIAVGSNADLLMWFSHGIATVITVFIILQGENALARLENAVFKVFATLLLVVPSSFSTPFLWPGFSSFPKVSLYLFDRTSFRGPPASFN